MYAIKTPTSTQQRAATRSNAQQRSAGIQQLYLVPVAASTETTNRHHLPSSRHFIRLLQEWTPRGNAVPSLHNFEKGMAYVDPVWRRNVKAVRWEPHDVFKKKNVWNIQQKHPDPRYRPPLRTVATTQGTHTWHVQRTSLFGILGCCVYIYIYKKLARHLSTLRRTVSLRRNAANELGQYAKTFRCCGVVSPLQRFGLVSSFCSRILQSSASLTRSSRISPTPTISFEICQLRVLLGTQIQRRRESAPSSLPNKKTVSICYCIFLPCFTFTLSTSLDFAHIYTQAGAS